MASTLPSHAIAPSPEPNDATPFLPERRSLKALREAAADCRGCHLWRGATQTVFGEGLKRARVMLVGEQPGDKGTSPGSRSSARPDASSTAGWRRPGSYARRRTSRTS
jgi:hypothetical protein